MEGNWVAAVAVDAVEDEEGYSFLHDGKDIGIFNLGGHFYAIENICPHAYQQLSEGFVDGEEVECPLHNALFHIPTGKCTREPGSDLRTYDVKIVGDQIMIRV